MNTNCIMGGKIHLDAVNNGIFDGFVFFMQSGGSWGSTSYDLVKEIIDIMVAQNKLDPFRISVHGLSAGGEGTWGMANKYPTYIAAALPMSWTSIVYKDDATLKNKLKWIPMWNFQGGLDGAPTPYTSKQVRDAMLVVGSNYKYTEYSNLGHGTWNTAYAEKDFFPFINRAHKANPWTLFGRTEFCPGEPINVVIGVSAGYNQYEWRKDGVVITSATSNQITVNSVGTYDCRILRGNIWSSWSPIPVQIKIKEATVSPDIQVSGIASNVIPALDGKTSVQLEVPEGYASYQWQKVGSSTTLSTIRTYVAQTPGDYRVKVTEQFGCSSDFSNAFSVIDANGVNKPDPAINLIIQTLSKTELKLDWSDNPSPQYNETKFEVYQSSQQGGPYTLIGFTESNVVSYVVDNLNPGTRYYFKVRAVNNFAASAGSNEAEGVSAADTEPPSAPANLRVSASTRNSISLAWDASTDDVGVTKYDIFIDGVKSFVVTNTEFTVNNLQTNQTYNFTVKARDFANNISPFSNQVTSQATLRGLSYRYYEGDWSVLPDFNTLTPIITGVYSNVNLAPRLKDDYFGFIWEGYINIPVDGTYTFRTNSDDGSKLYLGTLNQSASPYSHTATPLVNNDGKHGTQNRDGTITLTAGTYPIAITYFEGNSGQSIAVSWRTPLTGTNFVTIPDAVFADPVIPQGQAPVSPSNLVAKAVSFNKINLSWKDNSNNETAFEVYRSTSVNGIYSTIGTTAANATTFTDATAQANTRFYYKLKAIGRFGESEFVSNITEANWKLNNDFFDASDNGRLLVPASNPVIDAVTKVEGTHAVSLNGTSQYLSINTVDGFLKNAYSEKTVAFWMKSNSNTGNRLIVDIGGSDDGLSLRLDGNQLYAGVASNNVRKALSVPYTTSEWQHIALVYQQNSLKLYVNGIIAGTIENLGFNSIGVTTNGSRIGLNDGNNAFNVNTGRFSGWIDNFGIYGFALNGNDIVAHINNELGESNATSHPLPTSLTTPQSLLSSSIAPNTNKVEWVYNPATTETSTIPATTIKIEAESYVNQSGVSTQNSSEGTKNVTSIGQGDFMDYNIEPITSGMHTFNFRVANNTTAVQFQIRQLDGTVLATIDVPKTGNTQVYTTVSTNINLAKGLQTLRIYASKNSNWNFNWFEYINEEVTNTTDITNQATAIEIYRSSNNNGNYLRLTTVQATATSYTDEGLFANAVYYYKVRAVNDVSSSDFTNEDSAKTGNNIPALAAIDNQYVRYGTQLQLNIKATDADPDVLNLTVSNLPSFATFTTNANASGVISFSPALADLGTYENITVSVSDPNGGAQSISFKVIVNDNFNPSITSVNNLTLSEKQTAQVNLIATDQNVGNTLTFGFENLPDFATPVVDGNNVQFNFAPGYDDNGTYLIKVKVEDGQSGFDTTSFVVTVTDINPNKKVFINFTDGTYTGGAPWNNTNKIPAANDNFASLKDESGGATSVGFQVISPWQNLGNGTNTYGVTTGSNSGVYPDNVMRSAWFTDGNIQTIRIYGLESNYKYNFTFFGSRSGVTDNRTTLYTIGSNAVTLNAASNSTNTVSLNNLQPEADGSLTLTVQRATGSSFGYLNAMVIESIFDDGSVPAAPRNVTAGIVNNRVQLTWTDAAYNEKAYQVFKATEKEGAYTLMNPEGNNAGLVQYTDGAISGNKTYHYIVKAVNDYGVSQNNDTVSITIPNAAPSLPALADISARTEEVKDIAVTVTDDPGDIISLSASGLPSFVTFTDNGNGNGLFRIIPGNTTGIFENVTLTATDNKGASASKQFKITVTLKGTSSIMVNFNQVLTAAAPWNSFTNTPLAGRVLSNLKNDEGVVTNASITLVEGWEGANDVGATTGNNSGVLPDDVMKTAYFESSTNSKRIRISGLTAANTKYNLIFFASRGAINDVRNTVFSAGGKSVTLNVAGNTSKTVQINGLTPNADGVLEFTVAKASGTSYAYINAVIIQAYFDDGKPLAPANLQASVKSKSEVQLNWVNRNDGQTSVEVYRAGSSNGAYSLIATLNGNATSYTNSSLTPNTQYYYKVRALHNGVYTDYSNIVGTATLAYQVHVNFNQYDPAGTPWNNTNNVPQEGSVYGNLINELSNPSGINLTVVGNNFNGVNPYGMNTGSNSGIYPDNVIRSTWWLDAGATATLKIDGLNQSMAYNFVFFASRDGSGSAPDRSTVYSINGKTVTLNAVNNTSKTVQINNIRADENGAVYIDIKAASTSPFAYIGALVIEGYKAPDPIVAGSENETQQTTTAVSANITNNVVTMATKSSKAGEDNSSSESLKVSAYPNPIVDHISLKLEMKKATERLDVIITDAGGRIIYTRELRNVPKGVSVHRLEANNRNFQSGVYFIKVIDSKEKYSNTVKVIKL